MAAGSTDTLYPDHGRGGSRLGPPPADRRGLWEIPFAGDDLHELRQLLSGWAAREAMDSESVEDLVLSVHEIATNSVRHGGGSGMLRLWRTRTSLVCEVEDTGRIEDPASAGALRPGTSPAEGRGLWIAHQLCDLVEIHSGSDGTQVRMHKRLV